MNRISIVTGGAAGIGRCIVESFAQHGGIVYFIDNDAQATASTLQRCQANGWNVAAMVGDIADPATVESFAQMVLSQHSRIHNIVNNACIMRGGVLEGSYDDFMYVQRVGVAAPFLFAKLFKDHFDGLGSIVNISSTRAFQSQANTESYSAAKGGITALTHALAISLAGVARVNSVAPGWIDTGHYHSDDYTPDCSPADLAQHPSGRIGEPADIARTVMFLCHPDNSFINGENITVDGGMTKQMVYHNDYGWKLEL